MNYPEYGSNKPNRFAKEPWHPETGVGIRNIDLSELPKVKAAPEWHDTGLRFPIAEETKEAMIEHFYTNPTAGFAIVGNTVRVFEFQSTPAAV